MRLIDADDFFNRMNNDTDLCAEMEFEGLKALKKYLDLQPTAYSVDKVVEELEKELEKGNMAIDFGEFRLFEIVKQEAEQYQSSEIGFISKTEVLTLIEEIKCNDDIPKNYGTLLDIMRMIRNMPTVDNTDNGWIPCSERLPEESGTYIVNAIENSIIHVTFAKWMHRMKKWNLTGCRSYWKVNAWQPLPEPFKERD